MNHWDRWRRRGLLMGGLALASASVLSMIQLSASQSGAINRGTIANSGPEGATGSEMIRLGWTAWADAELISLMAQTLIQEHFDVPVERVMADIGIQFQSVARGDLDLMLMAWLPRTHKEYWQRTRDQVQDLGPMYTGRLGLVVPDYVPESEVGSVSDLANPEIAARFGNRIQGIDPGSGLNQASEEALEAYQLNDMQLVAANSSAMAAVLAQAIKEERWTVAASWTPHWMFARHRLRFLEDPLGIYGGTERIHAVARQGFDRRYPEIAAFLSRFELSEDELAAVMLEAQESSPQQAVDRFLVEHPERVSYWLTGTISRSRQRPIDDVANFTDPVHRHHRDIDGLPQGAA
jgi:glycine betaine/proline transport system substrate-binding protein